MSMKKEETIGNFILVLDKLRQLKNELKELDMDSAIVDDSGCVVFPFGRIFLMAWEELDRAKIVDTQNVSQKVITMNSKVLLLDLDSEKEYTWRLVYPKDENIDQGRISVLAPLGTAILGYCEGDIFEWEVPSGIRRFKVMKVIYQPEAAGDSNL